ncbi:hypothetical protein [Cryptosporangium sp. NPDC048952]|uniref:hypothetical protein n=1 Tax=Cryptosporangium sp. NPDC048952 TaxID=3363961 RepID=UPI003711A9DB
MTDDEALGVAIRRYRTERAKGKSRPGTTEPDALPPHDAPKVDVQKRLTSRVMALVNARAELEGINTTSVVDEHLLRYALGVPEDPQHADERQRVFLKWFTDGAHGTPPAGCSPGLISPQHEQALYEEAGRRGISARQLLTEILERALP